MTYGLRSAFLFVINVDGVRFFCLRLTCLGCLACLTVEIVQGIWACVMGLHLVMAVALCWSRVGCCAVGCCLDLPCLGAVFAIMVCLFCIVDLVFDGFGMFYCCYVNGVLERLGCDAWLCMHV